MQKIYWQLFNWISRLFTQLGMQNRSRKYVFVFVNKTNAALEKAAFFIVYTFFLKLLFRSLRHTSKKSSQWLARLCDDNPA